MKPEWDAPMYVRQMLAVRHQRHWTQAQLGQALGVSRRTIVNWEIGKTQPPLSLLAMLREMLGESATLALPEHTP